MSVNNNFVTDLLLAKASVRIQERGEERMPAKRHLSESQAKKQVFQIRKNALIGKAKGGLKVIYISSLEDRIPH